MLALEESLIDERSKKEKKEKAQGTVLHEHAARV